MGNSIFAILIVLQIYPWAALKIVQAHQRGRPAVVATRADATDGAKSEGSSLVLAYFLSTKNL